MSDEIETPMAVVFRKWPKSEGGDILALFPEVEEGRYLIGSYQHIGGYGSADYSGCVQATTPAKPEEYASLLREMEGFGWVLKIYSRGAHLLPWRNRKEAKP